MSAFILLRFNYCNAELASLLVSTLTPLQRVLYASARFVAGIAGRTHVSGIMKSLHWLPITYLTWWFKMCVLIHGVSNETSPEYLSDTTTSISSMPGNRRLCSATTNEFDVPRTRTQFEDRVVCVAWPSEWNTLSADIRNTTDLPTFKRVIKAHFFKLTYSD